MPLQRKKEGNNMCREEIRNKKVGLTFKMAVDNFHLKKG